MGGRRKLQSYPGLPPYHLPSIPGQPGSGRRNREGDLPTATALSTQAWFHVQPGWSGTGPALEHLPWPSWEQHQQPSRRERGGGGERSDHATEWEDFYFPKRRKVCCSCGVICLLTRGRGGEGRVQSLLTHPQFGNPGSAHDQRY